MAYVSVLRIVWQNSAFLFVRPIVRTYMYCRTCAQAQLVKYTCMIINKVHTAVAACIRLMCLCVWCWYVLNRGPVTESIVYVHVELLKSK